MRRQGLEDCLSTTYNANVYSIWKSSKGLVGDGLLFDAYVLLPCDLQW